MVAIQIRGISEVTRRALSDEAKARGESLQEYLLDVLEREAEQIDHRRLLADWAASPSADAAQPINAGEMIGSERENAPGLFVEQKPGMLPCLSRDWFLHFDGVPVLGAIKVVPRVGGSTLTAPALRLPGRDGGAGGR